LGHLLAKFVELLTRQLRRLGKPIFPAIEGGRSHDHISGQIKLAQTESFLIQSLESKIGEGPGWRVSISIAFRLAGLLFFKHLLAQRSNPITLFGAPGFVGKGHFDQTQFHGNLLLVFSKMLFILKLKFF
jgi:hypothetical protein